MAKTARDVGFLTLELNRQLPEGARPIELEAVGKLYNRPTYRIVGTNVVGTTDLIKAFIAGVVYQADGGAIEVNVPRAEKKEAEPKVAKAKAPKKEKVKKAAKKAVAQVKEVHEVPSDEEIQALIGDIGTDSSVVPDFLKA